MRTCFCFAVVLWVIPLAAWSQPAEAPKAPEKLQIGAVAGLPRPEGFVVQDLRSPEMKTATPLKQTYKAPMQMPFQRQPVPLAKYERVIGRRRAQRFAGRAAGRKAGRAVWGQARRQAPGRA
jgi:hypothetical protein